MNDDDKVFDHRVLDELLRSYVRADADATREYFGKFAAAAKSTEAKAFDFAFMYGAGSEKLGVLEAQRVYAEEVADHEVAVLYDQYTAGILTLDELTEYVNEANAKVPTEIF